MHFNKQLGILTWSGSEMHIRQSTAPCRRHRAGQLWSDQGGADPACSSLDTTASPECSGEENRKIYICRTIEGFTTVGTLSATRKFHSITLTPAHRDKWATLKFKTKDPLTKQNEIKVNNYTTHIALDEFYKASVQSNQTTVVRADLW